MPDSAFLKHHQTDFTPRHAREYLAEARKAGFSAAAASHSRLSRVMPELAHAMEEGLATVRSAVDDVRHGGAAAVMGAARNVVHKAEEAAMGAARNAVHKAEEAALGAVSDAAHQAEDEVFGAALDTAEGALKSAHQMQMEALAIKKKAAQVAAAVSAAEASGSTPRRAKSKQKGPAETLTAHDV